jgi:hypothetical protein
MFRAYLGSALTALGLYGFAQYQGWSLLPSEADEFQRRRAEQQESRTGSGSSTRSRSGGGFSGK